DSPSASGFRGTALLMRWMWMALLMLATGFGILPLVDCRAENLFGFISPLLIIGGYIVFGMWLWRDEAEAGSNGRGEA
ncbi:MAG: hypothetical protein PHQ23_15520, partial [Candidatus Wallbacteria bacterium]|nr:hypothetical protein [Candidatus Wallbacteria bacterium]